MNALANSVAVLRRFKRSIRIDADIGAEGADGFICTPTAAQALRTTFNHVVEVGHGAFTWTGSYGCGKSSLAVVLANVLGPESEARTRALSTLPEDIVATINGPLRWKAPGWQILPVTGRRENPESVLARTLDENGVPKGGSVANRLLSVSCSGGPGTVLIIDEMGKLLEQAASGDGDAYLFQELAEAASRSEGRLIVIGILHQAFDDYAYKLARETRDDWLKVQGRFVDVALAPLADEQLGLLSSAIDAARPPERLEAAETVARESAASQSSKDLARTLLGCWPLNPVVACLLGPLSRRRFGQNQRSLFGFLGSAEPAGFQEFLRSTPESDGATYDTCWLWDYLRINLEPSILASPDGHRWSLAIDALERCDARGGSEAETKVLKAVALIDNFRERSGLVASAAVIGAALPGLPRKVIEAALKALSDWSIVTFRRHLGGFSLFAGSDFDIEDAITTASAELVGCDFGRLRSTGVFSPVLAKRHYHQTGSMRWFEVDVASMDDAEERIAKFENDAGSVGMFLLLINEDGASKATVKRRLQKLEKSIGGSPIAIGVSTDSYMLRESSLELIAIERVQETRQELKGDPVARREIASRASRLAAELEDRLRSSLASTEWMVPRLDGGPIAIEEAAGAARLSLLASALADALYPSAPKIRNELVNRSRPSPNAMAALKALLIKMLTSESEEQLGIENYPPERGLYVSLLQKTGIHRERNGAMRFLRPDQNDSPGLAELWDRADDLLDDAGPEGFHLSKIHAVWRARPFGIKDGLLPFFSLAYLLSRQEKVSVYLDGAFCASLTDFFVDRMLQDSGCVRLRLINISDRHRQILHGVAEVTSQLLDREMPSEIDPLTVGRQLVAVATEAPNWVLRTSFLSETALKVRDLANAAHDPNKFMLDDIPKLFPEHEDLERVVSEIKTGLQEIAGAFDAMLVDLRAGMLRELGVAHGADGTLKERAERIVGLTGNYRLDAFATRLRDMGDNLSAMEGLASLAANKPPRDWVDRDVDAARMELAALAQEFLRAEGLAHVKGGLKGRTRMAIYISDQGRASSLVPDFDVDEANRGRAKALAKELRASIDHRLPTSVVMAALAELGAELAERLEKPHATPADMPDARQVAS